MMKWLKFKPFYLISSLLILTGCGDDPWNNPYKKSQTNSNTYYASFTERPKTLDPARSYSSNEALFTAQIVEPPLQYHYLKKPYSLTLLTATAMPTIQFIDEQGNPIPEGSDKKVAYTQYEIDINPNILYQMHPAFAKDSQGNYLYHHLNQKQLAAIDTLAEFEKTNTRKLLAEDYVYQIKRLAHPQLQSPIYGLMQDYIVGLSELNEQIKKKMANNEEFIDLRDIPLAGVKAIDDDTYQVKIKGRYPQFIYWLAMPFFSPVPWEADAFYSQPGLKQKNISFDWYPVGTGPYQLTENNPNSRMVLSRNQNFRGEKFPATSNIKDLDPNVLADAGQPMPFIDRYIFILEKESIPRWSKFLQGYYDQSGITADSFDQAIKVDEQGQAQLTEDMLAQDIRLETSISPSSYYQGFNMLDDVVGGYSERARKLRQAISIAINYEEYINIFLNGRGIAAQGPIPPGIFGFQPSEEGVNPYIYQWKNNKMLRHPLSRAKQLLAEAGYPDGRDIKTGKPLILHYDVPASSGPDDKARFSWMRKQFAKLGIQLDVRATQYNRFQEKMRSGNAQLFTWGWLADYPDPENFLFLLYGPNGKVKNGGENAANYSNPQFDKLFEQMKVLPNGPQRQVVINKMLDIVQRDAPWVWGFHPKTFTLSHQWIGATVPNEMANNVLKYRRLDPATRVLRQQQWNQPIIWPLLLLLGLLLLALVPVVIRFRKKELTPIKKVK